MLLSITDIAVEPLTRRRPAVAGGIRLPLLGLLGTFRLFHVLTALDTYTVLTGVLWETILVHQGYRR
jgi:hypothetical protein